MKPIVVIPTYNEALNIEKLVKSIFDLVSDISILVVDDNSPDNTSKIVENLKSDYQNLYLLNHGTKNGLASAYIDGFKYAKDLGFNTFIQMDADFSHNPKYLSTILELLKDYDVVIGSRNIKGGKTKNWSYLRNLISKGGSLYSRLVLGCTICDLTGGFNAWKAEVLDKIDLDNLISRGFCFQVEMKYLAYKNKFKIKEFPIIFEDRKFGTSKMSNSIFFEALLNIIKIKLKRG